MKIGNRRVKKRFLVIVGLMLVIITTTAGFVFLGRVHKEVTLEAGSDRPEIESFLKGKRARGEFVTDMSKIDMSIPGEYEIEIKAGVWVYRSTLNIVDTIPPTADIDDQRIDFGEIIEAEDFVSNIVDATKVAVSYGTEPDFEQVGDQDVTIVLEDLGANRTELSAILTISKTKETVEVEVGTEELNPAEFVVRNEFTGSFVTDISQIDLNKLGEYEIVIKVDEDDFFSKLKVVDTIPPKGDPVNKEIWTNDEIEAHELVDNIEDKTEVKIYYKEEPDFSKPGTHDTIVILEDEGGNKTELTAVLTIKEDTEPPKIVGDNERIVYIGDKVSYRKHVKVTDNRDEDVELEIDSSSVNLKKTGNYIVIYTARDSSGNIATKEINYIVKEKPKNYISQDQVDELADKVLESIIKDDMDDRQKARAIYDWTRGHVHYVNYENNTDWVRAAYDGFKTGRGDCYVYFGVSKALLTRAGIENRDIVKVNGGHFWSMVNLGQGWYHFDTTPRRTGGEFFMLTDKQLENYSKKNKNSHVWDREKYPATPAE